MPRRVTLAPPLFIYKSWSLTCGAKSSINIDILNTSQIAVSRNVWDCLSTAAAGLILIVSTRWVMEVHQ